MRALHDRLRAYLEALERRGDLVFEDVTRGEWPDWLGEAPDEAAIAGWDPRIEEAARGFARAAPFWTFRYRSEDESVVGSMNLAFGMSGFERPEWTPEAFAGHAVEAWCELDVPDDWSGSGTRYALVPGGARILHVYESPAEYPDLETYLTTGARRGFVELWSCGRESDSDVHAERREGCLATLRERSAPLDTPAETLGRELVRLGAPADDAAELLEWLGGDAALLVPRR